MTEENKNPAEESETRPTEPEMPKKGFLTQFTIDLLKGIINPLQATVDKLEAQPNTATTQTPEAENLRGWDKVLRRVRDRAPLTEAIPDFLLTTVLVGASLAVVWGAVAIIPENLFTSTPPAPEAEVSEQPEVPQPPIPLPEGEESQPEITPEPEPELTPEQSLIAAIQEQVSEITTRYAQGLIESLEANFRDGRLIIAVSEEWFNLSPKRQDELSTEMLARSRQLDFTKLVLTTPQGKLLARSPVVGEKMVILQRKTPTAEQAG